MTAGPVLAALAAVVSASATPRAADRGQEVVAALVEAFNRHDADAMVTLVDDAVEWLAIDGASVTVEARGREALREAMRGYFESCPSCRSELESIVTLGSRVAVLERASWETQGVRKSRRALAVYELRDGRVLRVHYFPAE